MPTNPATGRPAAETLGGRSSSVNLDLMRRQNMSAVLRQLYDHGPTSRGRLAAVTGLTKPVIARLVADLAERGLVRAGTSVPASGPGRPTTMLHLDGSAVALVAAQITTGRVQVRVSDLGRTELSAREHPIGPDDPPEEVFKHLCRLVNEACRSTRARGRTVYAVGVALAAIIDHGGRVVSSPSLGWQDVDTTGLLSEHLEDGSVPVFVDNVARMATLAESRLDPGPASDSTVRLEITTGIGAGLFMNGLLPRGVGGFLGAIGHIPLAGATQRCLCGRRGCLEALVGIHALLRAAAPDLLDAVRSPRESALAVAGRAQAGDPRALRGIRDTARWIGLGSSVVINFLNPERVVIGGYPTLLSPYMLPVIEAEVDRRVVVPGLGGTSVSMSALGTEAALLGAAEAGAQRVLDDPGIVPPSA
ncbi:ROK family transcriptional regulator [Kitasatospora sp. NA04385]|uniref:ROK family transcriptional regulator n=1 Tax=Kitasatospora sp. NA04385 TaxID=2742135 RepID=UPI0015921C81|nr:ROK family transcriptional regulator [Kitasatospora sp. NA04385]QKW17785.1 ROK family transcriptional regulator [Kitasatospora sp. NA04385]